MPFSGLLLSVCVVGTPHRERQGRGERDVGENREREREGGSPGEKPIQWGTALLAFQNGIYRK